MKLKPLFTAFVWLLWGTLIQAQNATIHGIIKEQATGEPLIGATVVNQPTRSGVVSDSYGHYSLTLPVGEVSVVYSFVGMRPETRTFTLTGDTLINLSLESETTLGEVVVVGQYNPAGVSTPQMSVVTVPADFIKKVPAIFGEKDVIKALQLLPGVAGGTEGTAGIYVRGGGPDQNLFMMDGIPIYNVNHLLGLFSNFNPDAVKNVTLYKGSFPARYGGRLSSVVDVRMRDGNDKSYHGKVSLGLISSKVDFEGPIIRERTTMSLSLRRTYLDVFQKLAGLFKIGPPEINDFGYYFYDANLKLTHALTPKDKLYLTTYLGDDVLFGKTDMEQSGEEGVQSNKLKVNWSWGNAVASLRWNHLFSPRLTLSTTAAYNRYRSHMGLNISAGGSGSDNGSTSQDSNRLPIQAAGLETLYRSGIEDLSVRSEAEWSPSAHHKITGGVEYIFHTFRPDVSSLRGHVDGGEFWEVDTLLAQKTPRIPAHEAALFISDEARLGDQVILNGGLRYSLFAVQGSFYHSLEPRVSGVWRITPSLSLKAGYAMMTQYIHLLSPNTVSIPTDLWVPSTRKITPMRAHQVAASMVYNLPQWGDFSVEGYYKTMNNLLEYEDGSMFLSDSKGWEEMVRMGKGWAYGVEFLWQRNIGKTTGWLGYAWSRSLRQFNRPGQELNGGRIFPYRYDYIHNISLAVSHAPAPWIDISASWTFRTGMASTLVEQYYSAPVPNDTRPEENAFWSEEVAYMSGRNNYRFPAYHRLDLSVDMHKKHKVGESHWNVSIYNAYCRQNPFLIVPTVTDSETNPGQTEPALKYMTIFPIIPTVSYTYSF